MALAFAGDATGTSNKVKFPGETGQDVEANSKTGSKAKDTPIILVVEDNRDLRKYISRNLESSWRVITAENGNDGLQKAKECIPDLVVTDVMMPVMDGMELCRQLKTDERTGHIPIILLTASADRTSKIEGLELGADDYIIKPFDAGELRLRVRNMLERQLRIKQKIKEEFLFEPSKNQPPEDDTVRHSPSWLRNFQSISYLPDDLVIALHTASGTRREVFGKRADEYFNAYHLATYINEVT